MNNLLNFSKMQALGNDFMVIDSINQQFSLKPAQIKAWSDRHFGIGFDQLLLISASSSPDFDYNYQIFNANGEEVGQCGNGARCVALYIHNYLNPKAHLKLKTKTTTLSLELLGNQHVKLSLPPPVFEPKSIPFNYAQIQDSYTLDSPSVHFHALSVGNPHAVLHIDSADNLNKMNISILGKQIEHHPSFPEKTNVNFFSILDAHTIQLRVWERGCGETLACGSGALASAVVARQFYGLQSPIQVQLRGGELIVDYPDIHGPILQIGPAVEVFQGEICY